MFKKHIEMIAQTFLFRILFNARHFNKALNINQPRRIRKGFSPLHPFFPLIGMFCPSSTQKFDYTSLKPDIYFQILK